MTKILTKSIKIFLHLNLIRSKRIQTNNIFTRLAFEMDPSLINLKPIYARMKGKPLKAGRGRKLGRNLTESGVSG